MLSRSSYFRTVFFASTLFLVLSCTWTAIKPNKPDFVLDMKTISASIRSLIITQEITFTGSELSTKGKNVSELELILLNAENPPEFRYQYNELGKEIARLLKQALKNPNQYDNYKIVFLFEETKGTVTRGKSADFSYKVNEL